MRGFGLGLAGLFTSGPGSIKDWLIALLMTIFFFMDLFISDFSGWLTLLAFIIQVFIILLIA